MKYLILFYCIFHLCLSFLFCEDGIINGKDDVLFSNTLAKWGYYDLATSVSERLINAKFLSFEQRSEGKALRCSILQIQGEKEEDIEKKSELFKEAVECYKALLPSLYGMKKFDMQVEMGDILISQARSLILQGEEENDSRQKDILFEKAKPFLEEAETIFSSLKKATDHAGRSLEANSEDPKEKERLNYATIRYQSWLGYARSLFFQGKIGKKNFIDTCLKELEAYIWDYEGRIGAYYAMIMRGMVMHTKKKYQEANDSFDNVIKALQDYYLFSVEHRYESNLGTGILHASIRKILEDKNCNPGKNARTKVLEKNSKWLIEGERKYIVVKDQNGLNFYESITSETAHSLRLQACYYKIQTLLEQKEFKKAIALVNEFQQYLKEIHQIDLEEREFGQAILLEIGKAYIAQREYGTAMNIAQKIAQKKSYWGFVARNLLSKWGKLDPKALQNIQNAYLVATSLWDKNQYQEAILSFLKLLEYIKSKEDMEKYGLDALEKLGQGFWILSLYHESGVCYQMIAENYARYDKIMKIGDKEQKINIAAKSCYWAYRAYFQSYEMTQDQEDKNLSTRMLESLIKNWPDSSYALNRTYDQAKEKEKAAELAKGQQSVKLYRVAAEAYQQVKPQADMYEPSFVYVGKCYYKAGEAGLKEVKDSQEEKLTPHLPKEIKEDYETALKHLNDYYEYTKKNTIPDLDVQRQARRQESLAQSYFYLGQIYIRLGNRDKASENFQILLKKYSDQGDMVAGAFYFLIRINADTGKLEEAEKILKEMENRYGTKSGSEVIQKYQSFSYYLLGKEYGKKAQEIAEIIQKEKNEDRAKELHKNLLAMYQKETDSFYQWFSYKENTSVALAEWIANKIAFFANKLLEETEEEEKAVEYFQKALPLFQSCLSSFKEEEKREQIEWKLSQCALRIKNWEMAITYLYPLFHKDLDKREKKREKEMGPRGDLTPTTQKEDATYMDSISQILTGLAEQTSYKNTAETYFFLLEKAHRDFKDDIKAFVQESRSLQNIVDKYISLWEAADWMEGKVLGDQAKKDIQSDFEKKRKEKSRAKEQKEIFYEYEKKCISLIDARFPMRTDDQKKEATLSEEEMKKKIKRICLYRAYDFTSRLVESLPRYTNPQIRFGFYDNPAWWEAKYRQVYILYLQENRTLAKNLIEILRIQQKKLGGPKYEEKFVQLLNKIR